MRGEKGRNAAQGRKKGVSGAKQLARPPLPFSFRVCVLLSPYSFSLRCTRCSERAASLAVPHSTGLPPMRGEKCIAGTGRGPYRGAKRCVGRAFSLSHSFVRFSFHCGQSIAMNSCECGTTNTHLPLFRIGFAPVRNDIIALRC
jgi:hypothetical protein